MDSVRFAVDADAYGRYWDAVHELDPNALDESRLAGGHEGHLTELLTEAGLRKVEELALPVLVEHATFEDWWGALHAWGRFRRHVPQVAGARLPGGAT